MLHFRRVKENNPMTEDEMEEYFRKIDEWLNKE
jgi:hypothetical protein